MLDDETINAARELRARGLSPKEIARSLGLRSAVAADLVRKLAAEPNATDPDASIVNCLINAGWSTGLTITGRPEWRDPGANDATGGLVSVLVARRRRHRRAVTACVYLVDVHCLGVKNAIGPRDFDDQALRQFTDHVFSGYHAPPLPAPIELARNLVLGALDYAHALGLDPHPDFHPARAHLGPWTGPSAITFGRDGKPSYTQGPYDDTNYILRTLRRAVGRNGFHYTAELDISQHRMTA
ncbi:MAG: helix-turn-helix domain-containing protein [Solirubrobacteraceae bacterium]